MSIFKQNLLKKNHTNIKNFSYEKGRMTLNFSVDISSKKDTRDFLALLVEAQKEVNEEIS